MEWWHIMATAGAPLTDGICGSQPPRRSHRSPLLVFSSLCSLLPRRTRVVEAEVIVCYPQSHVVRDDEVDILVSLPSEESRYRAVCSHDHRQVTLGEKLGPRVNSPQNCEGGQSSRGGAWKQIPQSRQMLRQLQAQPTPWVQSHETHRPRTSKLSYSLISDPQKLPEARDVCSFKLLSLG